MRVSSVRGVDGQDNVMELQSLLLESLFLDKIGADAKAEREWM